MKKPAPFGMSALLDVMGIASALLWIAPQLLSQQSLKKKPYNYSHHLHTYCVTSPVSFLPVTGFRADLE